jgi:hypothetical protein
MKFPQYVPAVAQKFFSLEIEALTNRVRELERQVPKCENLKENWSNHSEAQQRENGSRETVAILLDQLLAEQRHLPDRLKVLRRLAALDRDEVRMHDVYTLLRKQLQNDGQLLRYFAAAYLSVRDYSAYRERRQRAAALFVKIHEQSRALIRSIKELRETRVALPIGLREVRDSSEGIRFIPRNECSSYSQLQQIRTAGGTQGPDAVNFLGNLADVSSESHVTFPEAGDIDVAISKYRNTRSEYVRAFGHLLTHKHPVAFGHCLTFDSWLHEIGLLNIPELSHGPRLPGKPIALTVGVALADEPIALTAGVMTAMAATSTVILDDIDVSYDNVRTALASQDTPGKKRRNLPNKRKVRRQKSL